MDGVGSLSGPVGAPGLLLKTLQAVLGGSWGVCGRYWAALAAFLVLLGPLLNFAIKIIRNSNSASLQILTNLCYGTCFGYVVPDRVAAASPTFLLNFEAFASTCNMIATTCGFAASLWLMLKSVTYSNTLYLKPLPKSL